MRLQTHILVIAATLRCSSAVLPAQVLDKLSRSEVWQVRYCTALEFKTPSAAAKTSLQQLTKDLDIRVARQAFAIYSGLFVDLDRDIVRKAFDRGDFDVIGMHVADRKIFRAPEFWFEDLARSSDESHKARAVRAIGLCGDAKTLSKLSDLGESRNAYFLAELAVAFRRLGSDEQYLSTLESIFALSTKENVHYQTFAIECLLQTHPARAKPFWKRVNEELARLPDLQPNWVYAHILQRERLP